MSFSLRNKKSEWLSVVEIMGKWYCVGSSGIKKPNTKWPWHDFRFDTVFPGGFQKPVTGKERLWRTSVFRVKLPLNSQILFFDVLKGGTERLRAIFFWQVFFEHEATPTPEKNIHEKKYVVVTSDAKEKNPKMHQTLPLPEFRYSYPIPPHALFFLSWQ